MIIDRLLDKNNKNDVLSLKEILDHYVKSEIKKKNSVYHIDDVSAFTTWINTNFITEDSKNIAVYGRFIDGVLNNILVGYKIELTWGRGEIKDIMPHWCMGLIYYKVRSWKIPKSDIGSMSIDFCRYFQDQGYNKFYMVIKQPAILKTGIDHISYFEDHFKKMIPSDNYIPVIENFFNSQDDLDNYRHFYTHSRILPKTFVKPIMLISFTLLKYR